MYIGTLSDFFYKPKDFFINLPKFKQRQEITYLNINNRIFRINNITGNITLVNTHKKQSITINDKSFKNKAEYKSRNSCLYTIDNTSKTKETKMSEYANKTINNTTIKNNELNKLRNNNIKTSYKTKINKIPIFNLINASKTAYKINPPKIKSIKTVEETFKKQIFPYYNKSPKKMKKPEIIFGQKLKAINETIPNKKKINQFLTNDKNSFLTIYKQHYNNINNEGNNNKIYFETKNDNVVMKAFKEQILKEKIVKELKNKFKFFTDRKNEGIQIPNLSPRNFEFYNGYSMSDSKRGGNNYHKLFFKYINKHKNEERNENCKKIMTDLE